MKELSIEIKEKIIKKISYRISILKSICIDFYSEHEILKILKDNVNKIYLESKYKLTKGIYGWDNDELIICCGEDINEEDLLNDEELLDTCTHECLHALLLKKSLTDRSTKLGTGFQSFIFFNNNETEHYMGEGINEGLVELLTQIIKELWILKDKNWSMDKKIDFILKSVGEDSYSIEINILKQLIEIYGLEKFISAIVTIDCSTQKTYLSKFREIFFNCSDDKIVELLMQIDDISNIISLISEKDTKVDLLEEFIDKMKNSKVIFNVYEDDIFLSQSMYTPELEELFQEELKEVILNNLIDDETYDSEEIEVEIDKETIKKCLREYINSIKKENRDLKECLRDLAFSFQSNILALSQNTLGDNMKNKFCYQLMCEFISLINDIINDDDEKKIKTIENFLNQIKQRLNINDVDEIKQLFE